MTPKEIIDQLRCQVEKQDCYTERECAEHLSNISHILLPALDELYYVDSELNCYSGRADLTIIADRIGPGGQRRVAYIWELKAPQLYLFKMETKSRACPYLHFFEAENQLLHYHNELAVGSFRDKWKISYNDVLLGGIIIGRNDKLVKCKNREKYKNAEVQAKIANDIRINLFYNPNRMDLLTWDQVLWLAEKFVNSHQKHLGDPEEMVDYSASVRFTIPPSE